MKDEKDMTAAELLVLRDAVEGGHISTEWWRIDMLRLEKLDAEYAASLSPEPARKERPYVSPRTALGLHPRKRKV